MNTNYIFRLWIDGQAIFERDGCFFANVLLDESHIAVGLFTSGDIGFEMVSDVAIYTQIHPVLALNDKLELLQIIGISNELVVVAMQFSGNYEYFCLQKYRAEDVSDDLANALATGVDFGRESSFCKPYKVTFKNGKVWAIKQGGVLYE